MRELSDVDGLTAADVMHRRLTSLPASTTIRELREYFAASASRRLALIVDGERYVGSIHATALDRGPDDDGGALADHARPEPAIHPAAPAREARDLALADPSQRLPVVDETGALVGVVAINRGRTGFCGT
jgi:CBS domain-containing protein